MVSVGPVLRAEVGDTLQVMFMNKADRIYSHMESSHMVFSMTNHLRVSFIKMVRLISHHLANNVSIKKFVFVPVK